MSAKNASKPNLSADGIPQPGECSPMYYNAMTEAERAAYDRQCSEADAMKARRANLKARLDDLNDTGLQLAWIAVIILQVPIIGIPIVRVMSAVIRACNAGRDLFSRAEEA